MNSFQINKNNKNEKLALIPKEVIILIFCSVATLANALSYQIFLSQGPSEYLSMHFIVMIPAGIVLYLIRVLSHSLLVTLPKKESLFSSAFTFGTLLILFLLAILFLTQNLFLTLYEINSPLASTYFKLMIITASIVSVNSIFNYYLIFKKKLFSVLKVNVFTLMISIIGYVFCMVWLVEENRIIGFGVVKILAAILTLIVFFYYINPLVKIRFSSPFVYFKRAHKILFGDSLSLLITLVSPSVVNLILTKYDYKEYISLLGVSKTMVKFMTIPSGMLIVYATASLSKYTHDLSKLKVLIKQVKKLVWQINIVPALLIFLLFIIFLEDLWNIDFYPQGIFIVIFGLRFLPNCLEVPYEIINEIFEKQITLARISFYIQITSVVGLFILSYFSILNIYYYALFLLLLSMVSFLLTKLEAKKQMVE